MKKAGGYLGLCELSSQLAGEESRYRDLVYEFWIIFDGLLRAIKLGCSGGTSGGTSATSEGATGTSGAGGTSSKGGEDFFGRFV